MIHPLRNVGRWMSGLFGRRATVRRVACVALAGGVAAAGVCLLEPGVVSAYPEPSIYPVSWQFKFQHSLPKRISLKLPGEDDERAFWYLPFTVTNNTDREQEFLPEIEMVANDGLASAATRPSRKRCSTRSSGGRTASSLSHWVR